MKNVKIDELWWNVEIWLVSLQMALCSW